MEEEKKEENLELQKIEELLAKIDKMVEPEKYAEMEQKYNTVLNDYINRRPVPEKEKDTLKPVAEYAAQLSRIGNDDSKEPIDVTNRDYIQLSVNYRDAYLKETGKDPWTDDTGEPTAQTKKVSEVYKQLLKDHPGATDFRRALTDIMVDDPKLLKSLKNKKK
jgi:iron-sulfur cluster repair protein YtfE (RIC family)